ncbi:MAG: adenylosuccinate synthetase [Thiobacillus sp.]
MEFDIANNEIAKSRRRLEEQKLGRGVLTFVVGLQYGSEAKGSIVQHLAPGESIAVRTGASNAGHTIYYEGQPFVMRQIPGAWINPNTQLVIGAGALISPKVLEAEIRNIENTGIQIRDRLIIDANAHVITEDQIVEESKDDLAERIGSTSARNREGIGRAMADKVLRVARCVQVKNFGPLKEYEFDTVEYINDALENGINVIAEGTQGFSLSPDFGDFPYCTSRNATVSALADSMGVNPTRYNSSVIGVARSFPIRVAGNSGPFAPDSRELTWSDMKHITGNKKLKPEKTSVTGLDRRIATFSKDQYKKACRVNGVDEVALTFADYIDRSVYMSDTIYGSAKVINFINRLETWYPDALVTLVNTGPNSTIDLDVCRAGRLRQLSL